MAKVGGKTALSKMSEIIHEEETGGSLANQPQGMHACRYPARLAFRPQMASLCPSCRLHPHNIARDPLFIAP
jgi:hypothetical protein